ncbi:MAG: SPFH domain-containing protein [Candidatus Hydrogenedentota bacterium]
MPPWSVIEFQDDTGEIIVARVPQQGTAELTTGSQLLVQDGQLAVFFHNGKPTDGFKPGRYTLSTENLPVLSKVLNLVTYGKSPFRSYVYFLALKTFTDLGWGTSSPILFRDEEFRMVNLRANGSFAIRVKDPKVFIKTIVGTQGLETSYAVEQYLRRMIVSKVAQVLPTVMKTVLDLPVLYDDIAVKVKQAVHDQFDQYGLKLVDLIVESITVPPEVQEAIDRAAGTRSVGRDEAAHYERIMRTEALRDAAKQPGSEMGSGMAAGMGIGAGMGFARELAGQPTQENPQAQPQLTMDEVKSRLRDLKQLVDDGLITQDDFESKKKALLDRL